MTTDPGGEHVDELTIGAVAGAGACGMRKSPGRKGCLPWMSSGEVVVTDAIFLSETLEQLFKNGFEVFRIKANKGLHSCHHIENTGR